MEPAALVPLALEAAALALEAAAALVIVVSAARALYAFVRHTLRREVFGEAERRRFARGLLLGLDFTIGSDVLKIAVTPTMEAVLVVGLVAGVRTILTLVLEFEIRRGRDEAEGPEDAAAPRPRGRSAGHG